MHQPGRFSANHDPCGSYARCHLALSRFSMTPSPSPRTRTHTQTPKGPKKTTTGRKQQAQAPKGPKGNSRTQQAPRTTSLSRTNTQPQPPNIPQTTRDRKQQPTTTAEPNPQHQDPPTTQGQGPTGTSGEQPNTTGNRSANRAPQGENGGAGADFSRLTHT